MKDIKELIADIERDLVISIVLSVKHKRISQKEAREISREFLVGFPFGDYQELFKRLYILSDKYKTVRKVYVKYSEDYERECAKTILEKMREQIKDKNYDNAIIIAKGARYG